MKFMKLGSKPDSFQNDGDKTRYVVTELATDLIVIVGDVKFYLHKFPLLSKSSRLQKLAADTNDETNDEIQIPDIPGGPAAFEICAKFCYGMTVTLNAYNVVAARCAAEYLEMYETIEKGNLICKIEVFLSSSIFRSWKDSLIVLRCTKSFLPWSDELKIVSHCLDSIASKASTDTSKVETSYTYNRKKLVSENGSEPNWNGVRKCRMVPKDWWVEDLCELDINLYKRVVVTIKSTGRIAGGIIGEALRAYALKRLPGFSRDIIQGGDVTKNRYLVETIVSLIPNEKGSVSCGFLLKLLKAANLLECGEMAKVELTRRIGQQLEEATVADLLIRASAGGTTIYDVATAKSFIEEFLMHERNTQADVRLENESDEITSPTCVPDASKATVAKLVDGYLAEIARDPNVTLSTFVDLAETVSPLPRPSHDGLYRAIDMYLKEHPGTSKSERKRICRLMDCKKLSGEACMHAVQNDRLPLRVIVQVLFFGQARAAASSGGGSMPDLRNSMRSLPAGGSNGSSRSATTSTGEEWDNVATACDFKALKGELTSLRFGGAIPGRARDIRRGGEEDGAAAETVATNAPGNRMKGLIMSRIFSKLRSGKEGGSEISSSDASGSPGSANAEETKSTPSRSRRHSVS